MNRRPPVPRSVERKLWAESMGHCMSPDCQVELYQNGTNLGEMAHMVPHAEGGDVTFENLLLLCLNCHTQIDENRTESTMSQLNQWKSNRNAEISRSFEKSTLPLKSLKPRVCRSSIDNYRYLRATGPLLITPMTTKSTNYG